LDFGETLVSMTAIMLGSMVVLLPIAALTIRYAIRPMLESWAIAREAPLPGERIQLMERRIELLEKQVEIIERDNLRLLESSEFEARLRDRA
jgi:hypothetical protein